MPCRETPQRASVGAGRRGPAGTAVSAADAAGDLTAGIEVVERLGDVVDREGEEQGGYRVGACLGVLLDALGGEGLEVRADGDAQVGTAAAGRLEVSVELGQPGGQLLGGAIEGVPAL